MVDQFVLESPDQCFPKIIISGKVMKCDRDYIYVDIFKEKDVSTLKCNKGRPFDMRFKINRIPYQIQHKSLDLLLKLNLHPLLIANKRYDRTSHRSYIDNAGHSYDFKGKLTANLNTEQRLVVSSILKMNKTLPYLLFGPAGSFIINVIC